MKKRWLACLALACSLTAVAETYGDNPAAVKMMQELAVRDGYDSDYLQSLLLAVSRDDSVLEKISRPRRPNRGTNTAKSLKTRRVPTTASPSGATTKQHW